MNSSLLVEIGIFANDFFELGSRKPPRFTCVHVAAARDRRPHRRGHGEEDGGADRRPLRPAGRPHQQRRDPGHGQHRDHRPGPVRQGHGRQRQVGFITPPT